MVFSTGAGAPPWANVTGKPKFGISLPIWTGGGGEGGYGWLGMAGNAAASTAYSDGSQYLADSAAVTGLTIYGSWNNIDWSKISGLASAEFNVQVGYVGGTVTSVGARLYDETSAAAITGSAVDQASPVSGTVYRLVSGDISANLPTARKELTFQLRTTYSVAATTVRCYRAEIYLYY